VITMRSRLAVQKVVSRGRVVVELVEELLKVFRKHFSKTFFPVPQEAIGVGSSFEGWSPNGEDADAVYHLLVPLKPPRGFRFQVEAGAAKDMPTQGCVLLELEHTCSRGQHHRACLCFYHNRHGELKRDEAYLVCTGCYLGMEKVAQWFQQAVSSVWEQTPLSTCYTVEVLPSSRSCGLRLTDQSGRSFSIELLFGVQRGDSHIFLSSQAEEAISTSFVIWEESYAVAEKKFFSHVAQQAPEDTCFLECLQLLASILEGTRISSYALKTVFMHVLNSVPITHWSQTQFLMRVQDVTGYLQHCLEKKCLEHFIFGNKEVPGNISLP
ncbi:IPIL1 protein, partial [Turnix velox]|nr:IPIL1 protein [Turnix velox]